MQFLYEIAIAIGVLGLLLLAVVLGRRKGRQRSPGARHYHEDSPGEDPPEEAPPR